jgi:hypothetical protein
MHRSRDVLETLRERAPQIAPRPQAGCTGAHLQLPKVVK